MTAPVTQRAVRSLTPDEQLYMELDRLWRYHTALLAHVPFCYHGVGANRGRYQDGCPWCFSNRTIDDCERRLNALGKVAAA